MKLSIVIPARNEAKYLPEQLDALLAEPCDGDWEVIVVDNGSTDDTANIVRDYASRDKRFRLVEATERGDQNYAANTGVAVACSSNVAFCDADDVVGEGWVATMMAGLENYDVVTGPEELQRLNPPWLAFARGSSGTDSVGTFCGVFPTIRGNNFAVRSSVWERVGPLCEGWRAVHDQEFSLRCWLNDIEIVGLPNARVHYRYRSSASDLWRQGFAYGSHRPRIARLLKESGHGHAPRFVGWKAWLLLVLRLPTLVSHKGRTRWVWIAGNRVGQVVGSLRERTIML